MLQARNMTVDVVEYLCTPPAASQIADALALLALEPREFMRTGESMYRDLNLDDPSLTRAQLIAAMHDNPILIQRPVVFANGKARIGRPPEAILEIL